MIAFAVLGRLLYFFAMQIGVHITKPTRSIIDGSMVLLLAILPIVSAIIVTTIVYIGMTTKIELK